MSKQCRRIRQSSSRTHTVLKIQKIKIKMRTQQNCLTPKKRVRMLKHNKTQMMAKLRTNLKPKLKTKDGVRELPWWIMRCTKFETFVSAKKLMSTSIKTKTAKQYRSVGKKFYGFLAHWRSNQPDLPKIEDLLNNFDIFQLDSLIYNFLAIKFNHLICT